jgi:hypothetical protein
MFPRCWRGATCAWIPSPPPGTGSLLLDTTQELVAALSTDLDATRTEIQEVKRKLKKTIREKAILEARLRGDPELPRSTTSMTQRSTCQSHLLASASTMESPATAPTIVREDRFRN